MLENINIEDIKKIAIKAGDGVMAIYENDFTVKYKEDNSPLTEADIKANEIICTKLQELYPNIPIMSEENKQIDYEVRKDWEYYWCIDPIDGTKEFIKKNGEFTVNIALIHVNIPVLGVVYAPVLKDIYYAKKSLGAFKNNIKLPINRDNNKFIIMVSKSHMSEETQNYIDKIKTVKEKVLISKGSSLKLCLVADGSANIYPRLTPTMEWDTAAAHVIVLESGKKVVQYKINSALKYNKKDLLNPWFIVE